MGSREAHHKAHGVYTEPWDVPHTERHLMAKVQSQLIDTVNATEGYEIEAVKPLVGDCEKPKLLPTRSTGVKFLKFVLAFNKHALGRHFYAHLEGTRKPVSLGAAFALGPRNSVVVLTLPLVELSVGFSQLPEYEKR